MDDNCIDLKQRGRLKYANVKVGNVKKKRARTTSPAGGNSAKCCQYCCPKYAIKHTNITFIKEEVRDATIFKDSISLIY
jgi:hypothetical protein